MSHTRRLVIAAALVATACGAPSIEVQPVDTSPTDGGAVQFDIREISAENRDCGEENGRCARVRVVYPETTGGSTEAVRENIDLFIGHDLVSRMRGFVSEDVGNGIGDTEGLAAAFLAQHRAFIAEFPESAAEWSIDIEAKIIFNTPEVTTIDIAEFAYTGGAHPNSRRRLVSFDVATGQHLGVEDLTTDIDTITAMVERQLRIDRGLGADADLEAAGFWFPDEGFTLPDNLGITSDGVVFHWDAYEIAPYSMGPTDVIVPAGELAEFIDRKYW